MLPCHFLISVCLGIMDLNSRAREENAGLCDEMLLNLSYKDHIINEEVRRKIQAAIGEYDELLTWSRNKN